MNLKPRIAIAALGGTICMSSSGEKKGVIPALNANDLIEAVPMLEECATIFAQTLQALPSCSIQISHILEVLVWAEEQIAQGAKGVVITQGTDTLEESSFLLNLLWKHKEPLVMTGAMRTADSISADGAANILASVLVACSNESYNRGVLVVLNDTIHSAKLVKKSHTLAVNTFISLNGGIQGIVAEHSVKYVQEPLKRVVFNTSPTLLTVRIGICQTYLNDNADIIEFYNQRNYNGIVINGFGAGHVSFKMMEGIRSLESDMLVVVSSRTGSGPTAYKTYGYDGSEIVLQENNVIMAGWLDVLKARLLLLVSIAAGKDHSQIKEIFASF